MFNQIDLDNLLRILPTGRQHAIRAADIERQLHQNHNFPISGNQVRTRGLITFAIERGHLIKSSTGNPKGYWLVNEAEELRSYVASLRRRAGKIMQRAQNVEDNI